MIQCPFCFAIPTNKKFFSCKNRWERFCQAIKLQILFCHCLIFFFFSSVTRSASTATAAWQVFCLWSLQRFQQGLNVHRWKLFNIWNLKCFLIVQIIHLVWSQGDCDYTSPPFRNLEIEEMIRNYELEVTPPCWHCPHIKLSAFNTWNIWPMLFNRWTASTTTTAAWWLDCVPPWRSTRRGLLIKTRWR